MKKREGNNESLGITLRRIGSKQSLPFIIFLSVVCLLVYLFALYLFSVRGIINQFGVETHREKLADCVALLSIEISIPEDGLGELSGIIESDGFQTKYRNYLAVESGKPFIFNRENGNVEWGPDLGQKLTDVVANSFADNVELWEYSFGDDHTVLVRDGLLGESFLQIAHIDIGRGYALGMLKDQSDIFSRTKQFERTLSGFLAIGFLVFLVFFIAIIKILTQPLHRLSKAARDITEGDFDVRLKTEFGFINEISELSRSFNKMAYELKKRADENLAYESKIKLSNINLEAALNKLKLKYQELRNLNNISLQIHRIYDSDRIVGFALEHIRMTNDLSRAAVYMKEETADGFVEISSSGDVKFGKPSEVSLERCLHSSSSLIETDLPEGDFGETAKRLILPIELGESTMGVCLLESEQPDEFNEERIDYFLHLTSHIFSIVRNKLLLQDSLKRTEELRRINRISERISGELDLGRLFNEIARSVRASLGAAGCAVLTREADGILRVRSIESVSTAVDELPFENIANNLLRQIVDTHEPLLIADASADQRFIENPVLSDHGFRSFVGTPMFYQGSLIGIICAVNHAVAAFDERDVNFLSTVGNQAATAFENATLFEIIKERDSRRDKQLTVAQKFQRDRIPSYFEKGKIEIHSSIAPAEELAGDFFDVFTLGPSTIGFVIGDVATKGIPASLMTFSLLSMFRNNAKTMRSPAKVLKTINANVSSQIKEDTWFTTAFYGRLNTRDLTLVYAKAGHEMPILHRRALNEVIQLDANGLPLGIYDNSTYEAKQVQLEHGDRLILFTDGVVEAVAANGERFGRRRLVSLVKLYESLNAEALCDKIMEEVGKFSGVSKPQDDILVAVLEVKADPWVHKTITYNDSGSFIEEVMNQLKHYNLDKTTLYSIRLSLDESLANAHKHGNAWEDNTPIDVSFLITTDKFCLKVRDSGHGFNYESLPDPTVQENLFKTTGRGVFLMRQMLDEVEYNEVGNEIQIIKHFPKPEEIEEL